MVLVIDRRSVLKSCTLGTTSLITTVPAYPQVRRVCISTYIYKKSGGLEIKADVYRAAGEETRPVVIWIHGGALTAGSRTWIDEHVKDMMLDAGYVFVSVDYRLAPETKLPLIIEDIEDAYTWVYRNGPELFHADTTRIAVMGASAGGYLTLTAGYRVEPRPSVLVSFYGYGALIGDVITRAEWPQKVSGWDPQEEKEKFYPYMPVKNVTEAYPPTLLIHGTDDTGVPYHQSVMMAEELETHGVTFKLITIPGAEHGLRGGDPKRIEDAYEATLNFVNQEMRKSSD